MKTEIEVNTLYQPLYTSSCRYYLISGGRGSGKSFATADFLLRLTYQRGEVILFTRFTLTSAHISIIPEFVEKIEEYNLNEHFSITKNEIENKKTGSKIIFRGIKTSSGNQTANLKSITGLTCWVLDEAEELPEESIFDKIDDSIRQKGKQNRVILILNPTFRSHWIYNSFVINPREDVEYIHTSYLNNIKNLSDSFIEKAERIKQVNPMKYENTYMGAWIDHVDGALWTPELIEHTAKTPAMDRIVIAIDPSATKTGDETGIIAAGKARNGKYYILSDRSGQYSPGQWGQIAANEMSSMNADCYVIETNQGGDMAENVLRQYDRNNRIIRIHANKGKQLRAEPIVSLYERGLVLHSPGLSRLENEMLTWIPGQGDSPNRVDAMVYALSQLVGRPGQLNRSQPHPARVSDTV